MRKVIVYVNLTVDGYLCGPAGEMDWMDLDPVMNSTFAEEMRARVDTILIGRAVYQGFEQNFRAQAADPASEPGLVDFATWMVDTPKLVLTNTLTEVSEVSRIGADLAAVTALKKEPGRDIVVFGGVQLVTSLVEAGLVDEYWLKLAPTAIGTGRPLFTQRAALTLVDSRAWPSGTVTVRYTAG